MIWVRLVGVLGIALALALVSVPGAEAGAGPSPSPAATGAGPPGTAPSPQDVLKLAVEASRTVGYEGDQSVMIVGQTGVRTATLHVAHGNDDSLMIEAQPGSGTKGWILVQQGRERAAMAAGGGSPTVGQAALAAGIEPDAAVSQMLTKYHVSLDGTVEMLQRTSWVLRITRAVDTRLVERWTVDARSGLILARDSYDAGGHLERSVSFTSVQEPFTPPKADLTPPAEPSAPPASQQWFARSQLPAFARQLGLPARLPDGYSLEAATRFKARHATVVQMVYSDGLEQVSLFQQPGAVGRGSAPAGATTVAFAHEKGYLWGSFPRGAAWQAGSNADTLVGASPVDELKDIVNALPQGPMGRSVGTRIGHLLIWLRDRLHL